MHAIEGACRVHHGVISTRALAANGFGRSEIAAAVRRGDLIHSGRGNYRVSDAPQELVTAASLGSSLTCVSAAQVLGWWVLKQANDTHVRADKAISAHEIKVHRGKRSAARLVATPVQIISDAFACLPPVDALVLAESAVVKNAVSAAVLRRQFTRPQDWRIRALLADVNRRTASPLETCARYYLRKAGWSVDPETAISGVGRVDFLVEGRLIVEIDGFEFHSSRENYRRDRSRWNHATAQGWMTLRVTAEMVLFSPEAFVNLVRAALASPSR